MEEKADRWWAWLRMAAEYERIKGDKAITAAAKKNGYSVTDIANALKERYGTSGHSLTDKDQRAEGGRRIVGFIDFSARGIKVTRYEEETPSGQREEVRFTWRDYAKAVIHYMKEEAEAKAFSAGEAKARSETGKQRQKQEEKTMTMLAETKEGRVLSLADYEARIQLYKEQIGTGYIGIGRTLNEAKEAKVVPHGQWESWVTQTTGLTPRQAQRCMQAATEIREGSAMARLEMSKALMLLGSGLDEDTREEIAERAAEEGATVKELREELKKAKLQVVQETGAAMEIRDALRKAEEDRASLEQQMRATVSAYQARMDEEVGKAYQRGVSEKAVGLEKEIRKEFQGKIDFLNSKAAQAEDRVRDLKAELEDSRKDGSQQWDKGYQAAKKEIDQLSGEYADLQERLESARKEADGLRRNQGDLLAAAEEAEKRAADAEAELEAMRAGGAGQPDPAWKVIRVATDRFMTDCQMLPVTDAAGVMRDEKRISGCLDILESWIRMTRDVFAGVVAAEGAVQ